MTLLAVGIVVFLVSMAAALLFGAAASSREASELDGFPPHPRHLTDTDDKEAQHGAQS